MASVEEQSEQEPFLQQNDSSNSQYHFTLGATPSEGKSKSKEKKKKSMFNFGKQSKKKNDEKRYESSEHFKYQPSLDSNMQNSERGVSRYI